MEVGSPCQGKRCSEENREKEKQEENALKVHDTTATSFWGRGKLGLLVTLLHPINVDNTIMVSLLNYLKSLWSRRGREYCLISGTGIVTETQRAKAPTRNCPAVRQKQDSAEDAWLPNPGPDLWVFWLARSTEHTRRCVFRTPHLFRSYSQRVELGE